MSKVRLFTVIFISVLVSLILSALPLPSFAVPFQPYWTTLVVVYWCLALPEILGIKFAFFTGLFVDLISSTIIGEHALIYTLIAYMTLLLYSRIRLHPFFQQTLVVGVLLMPQLLIGLWIEGMLYGVELQWLLLMPLLTSMLVWPWIFSVLRLLRHKIYVPQKR